MKSTMPYYKISETLDPIAMARKKLKIFLKTTILSFTTGLLLINAIDFTSSNLYAKFATAKEFLLFKLKISSIFGLSLGFIVSLLSQPFYIYKKIKAQIEKNKVDMEIAKATNQLNFTDIVRNNIAVAHVSTQEGKKNIYAGIAKKFISEEDYQIPAYTDQQESKKNIYGGISKRFAKKERQPDDGIQIVFFQETKDNDGQYTIERLNEQSKAFIKSHLIINEKQGFNVISDNEGTILYYDRFNTPYFKSGNKCRRKVKIDYNRQYN